ncbi:MAG TPA: carbohydrate ABC transporter permease [Fimbriimonadales bacterium]|nr:carbohydrate ABC transporter permease [Fimbriimonadales bacterium]
MPLISKVGRKTPRARIALAVVYLLLILGGVTMVYPFMLMVATGMKGATDQNDNHVIPAYWSGGPELLRKYVDDKYSGKVDTAASFYGLDRATALMSSTAPDNPISVKPLGEDEAGKYEKFLASLPLDWWEAGFRIGPGRISSVVNAKYQQFLRTRYKDLDALNKAYLEQNIVFQTVEPPVERFQALRWEPAGDQKWRDWQEFKSSLPPSFRIPITVEAQWRQYLRSRYNNQLARVPAETRGDADSFESIPADAKIPEFASFYATKLPPRYRGNNADNLWRSLSGESALPQDRYDAYLVSNKAGEMERGYTFRNFGFILDYILLHGRAVWNTFMFCLLAVLTHLIVNPLAAYALSRYNLPSGGKWLLFLLATMAFPAEVTMIPGFLLLRSMGLLNTFAALVLPTAASGYSIYLLKGFFDSLPKDLYENAEIEGAKESTMLFRITLPLSKPVLAVIALTSFMAAYSAFMFAFLVAQDERMWTITVWIYQLQSRAPKGVLMAALTLAAIPTLLVFLAAQRVILRGIILPGEK